MLIENLARSLRISPASVVSRAKSASHCYKSYEIPKRSGGTREIHHPSRPLKAIQRWLLLNVIESWAVHPAAKAYRPGTTILDNAKAHTDSNYLLRMDFQKFFESIREADIRNYCLSNPSITKGWDETDLAIFILFVCRHGALTIGAPTSPAISNAICYSLDSQLAELALTHNVSYTRYADDLFFSAKDKGTLPALEKSVFETVSKLKIPGNLKLNVSKTRHSSKKGRRMVTGIHLGSDGKTHVPRDMKRRIRAQIHQYDTLIKADKATLAGLIAFVAGLEPDFLNALIIKYGLEKVELARRQPSP